MINRRRVISARGLKVAYGPRLVLDNVWLEVAADEFVAIVGPSGGGKSSLIHALARYISFSGEATIAEHFGFVFQANPVFPFLTVEENVGLGIRSGTTAERQERISANLQAVDLTAERYKYPSQLSGGQVQRVALARALAALPEPEILYCDEPFGALDVFTRAKMQELLLGLWEQRKMAVVFVTHSIEEAIFLADRVILLKDASLKEEFLIPFDRPRSSHLKFEPAFVEIHQRILEAMETK